MLPEEEPQAKGLGEGSRLTGVFFEPAKTFADVAERPGFWAPLILAILVGIAYNAALGQRLGFDRVVYQQMQGRLARLSGDQLEQAQKGIEMQKRFAPVGAYIGAVLVPVILGLIASGALFGMVAGVLSVPLRFKQVFAIWMYSAMPILVFYLLAIVVMYIKPPDDFYTLNPLVFNPGAFLDPGKPTKFLYSLFSSLDLFNFWRIWVLIVGLKAAAGKKLSMGGATLAVLLPWGVMVLIGGVMAGIFM